jgi:hypothetical protein
LLTTFCVSGQCWGISYPGPHGSWLLGMLCNNLFMWTSVFRRSWCLWVRSLCYVKPYYRAMLFISGVAQVGYQGSRRVFRGSYFGGEHGKEMKQLDFEFYHFIFFNLYIVSHSINLFLLYSQLYSFLSFYRLVYHISFIFPFTSWLSLIQSFAIFSFFPILSYSDV